MIELVNEGSWEEQRQSWYEEGLADGFQHGLEAAAKKVEESSPETDDLDGYERLKLAAAIRELKGAKSCIAKMSEPSQE